MKASKNARTLARLGALLLALALSLLLIWSALRSAPAAQAATAAPTPLPGLQTADSPDISFIDSPTAACTLIERDSGECAVSWQYLYVTADPNYVISMTVAIDGQLRGYYAGFFQQYMYVPSELAVFKVACGKEGSGGKPGMGLMYGYTIRARDSAGLKSANYGAITCPADEARRRIYLPFQAKR